MNARFLVPLCAAAALISACSDRNNDTGVGGESATDTPVAPPADPNVTPGTTTTPAENPPADPPPPTN